MKDSNYSFFGPDMIANGMANRNNPIKAFDWDKAANFIKQYLVEHPDLTAEAGLENDWAYTGGVIFENGKPTNENYTYLSSTWAIPTLILSWDGDEQISLDCYGPESERFNSDTKWDDLSLSILGIQIQNLLA